MTMSWSPAEGDIGPVGLERDRRFTWPGAARSDGVIAAARFWVAELSSRLGITSAESARRRHTGVDR